MLQFWVTNARSRPDFVICETGMLQIWQRVELDIGQFIKIQFDCEQMG